MIPINPNDPIRTLQELKVPPMTEEQKEIHNIFMLLSLTLVYDNWCIPKNDRKLVESYKKLEPDREFSDYVGHNIGALLVGPGNSILCYAFNNNDLYNHSTEHAEARVVRKGLRIRNRLRFKSGQGLVGYSSILRAHTVYTTPKDDINTDHQIVHNCTLVATRPLPGSPVRRVLSYEIGPTSRFGIPIGALNDPFNVFVDISAFIDTKLKAMSCYTKEIRAFPHPRSLEGLRIIAQERGLCIGLEAVESFRLIREIR